MRGAPGRVDDGAGGIVEGIGRGNEALVRHIVEAHRPSEDVGQSRRGPAWSGSVFTHFVSCGVPEFDRPEFWLEAVRSRCAGEIFVGRDLLEIAF